LQLSQGMRARLASPLLPGGTIQPLLRSRLQAIMGPSGCGKTTLLDTLAGRLAKNAKFAGEIRVNGHRSQLSYGRSAYVTQDVGGRRRRRRGGGALGGHRGCGCSCPQSRLPAPCRMC
jgi:hypothetical protein